MRVSGFRVPGVGFRVWRFGQAVWGLGRVRHGRTRKMGLGGLRASEVSGVQAWSPNMW